LGTFWKGGVKGGTIADVVVVPFADIQGIVVILKFPGIIGLQSQKIIADFGLVALPPRKAATALNDFLDLRLGFGQRGEKTSYVGLVKSGLDVDGSGSLEAGSARGLKRRAPAKGAPALAGESLRSGALWGVPGRLLAG